MDFFPEIEIDEHQAQGFARGLYGVAAADGVHERELALISQFYRNADDDNAAQLTALERLGAIEPSALYELLPGTAHRELFVKASLLVAYADGKVSAKEREALTQYAVALAVDAATQARLEAEVKDFLLRPLARLANVEAVSAIAKKLGV